MRLQSKLPLKTCKKCQCRYKFNLLSTKLYWKESLHLRDNNSLNNMQLLSVALFRFGFYCQFTLWQLIQSHLKSLFVIRSQLAFIIYSSSSQPLLVSLAILTVPDYRCSCKPIHLVLPQTCIESPTFQNSGSKKAGLGVHATTPG